MLGTASTRTVTALALAATLLLGACGGDDDDAATDDTSASDDTSDTSGSDDTTGGDDTDDTTGGDTSGDGIDVCSFLTGAEVSEAVGSEFPDGVAAEAQGSLLGQCDYAATDVLNSPVGIVSVSARPAGEYDASVEVANGEPVDGFDVDANLTDAGLMLRFDDFMIVVFAVGTQGGDDDVAVAVGQVLAANIG